MAEMKTLNGHEIVDAKARARLDTLEKGGVGGGGGDVTTEAMNKAIADAIQEHNEQIQVHPNRIDPMAAELMSLKQTVSGLTAEKVGADPAGTAATKVSEHDTYTGSHNDIRLLIQGLSDRLNALANSDDTTLDDLKEIVTYIKANKSLIDSITTSKVSVTDIIDNLTTNVSNRPLSAAQGVALKNLIDALGNSKLDASALGAAVNQALLIAKESGEFKGETGTSVTVSSVSESTESGGENIVKFSDGKTLTVKNGKDGPQGPAYTLTEDDKALIVAQVIQSLGGEPIFGYVDEDNNIIVQGKLPDGTYTVKFEMEDGSTVDIGDLVLDSNTYYSVTKNLTNCTVSNSATQVVEGGSYSATVTANSGYTLDSVSVTMGGSAVSVSGGVINIASVTGDIVITAVASEAVVEPTFTNLADPTSSDWKESYRLSISSGSTSALAEHTVTNFIPCKAGDVLRVKGLKIVGSIGGDTDLADYAKIVMYNSSKTKLGGLYGSTDMGDNSNYGLNVTTDGDVSTLTVLFNNEGTQVAPSTCASIRIDGGLLSGYTKNDVIITINQEITD